MVRIAPSINFIFVSLAHLHVLSTWYHRISSNNIRGSYFKINFAQRAKSRGKTAGKNMAIPKYFGIYKLSIYENRVECRI